MNYDIAIVGAGIVGAACAFRLAEEGFRTVVIEAGEPGGGATAAGMGHIVVMDDSEAQFRLTNYSQKLWNRLGETLHVTSEYENCGTIWVAADEEDMEIVRQKREFYEINGVNTEILDEKALKQAEPNLREGLPGGLLVNNDSVVYQPRATRYFLDKAKEFGAEIIIGHSVAKISENQLTLADGNKISAERIIVAAGTLSGKFFDDLPIINRKGHLIITDRYPGFVRHQVIELGYLSSAHARDADSVAFNVQPRFTDQVLIGSSRQFGVDDTNIDYQILSRMIRRALVYMPQAANLSATRAWTGFRPATPDNLPYIGRHPSFENVYVAAGHEGLGITTSLGTAELLTDEIIGRPSQIPREPYSPARSFGKSPKSQDHSNHG